MSGWKNCVTHTMPTCARCSIMKRACFGAATSGSTSNDLSSEARRRIAEAEEFMARLAATLRQPNSLRSAGCLVERGAGHRAANRYGPGRSAMADLFMPLVAALAERGEVPPDWVDPAELAALLVRNEQDCSVVCDATRAVPCCCRPSLPVRGRVRWANRYCWTRWCSCPNWRGPRLAGVGCLPRPAVDSAPFERVHAGAHDTAREAITVAAVRRPRGVLEWGCHGNGFTVRSPALGGMDMQWSAGVSERKSTRWKEIDTAREFPQSIAAVQPTARELAAWACDSGGITASTVLIGGSGMVWTNDDLQPVRSSNGSGGAPAGCYGHASANILPATAHTRHSPSTNSAFRPRCVSTSHGTASQRLRWIEPGSFLMGSPDDEPERSTRRRPAPSQ